MPLPFEVYREALVTRENLPEDLRYTPERFRQILKRLGLTQRAAADLLGVSKSGVAKWALDTDTTQKHQPSPVVWEYLLLIAQEHPYLQLIPKLESPRTETDDDHAQLHEGQH